MEWVLRGVGQRGAWRGQRGWSPCGGAERREGFGSMEWGQWGGVCGVGSVGVGSMGKEVKETTGMQAHCTNF